MISVPEDMQPTHKRRYASNGIEAVSTTLLLADNTQIQIELLYRSPSIPLQALTSLLSNVLNHVSVSSLPCIILGIDKRGLEGLETLNVSTVFA